MANRKSLKCFEMFIMGYYNYLVRISGINDYFKPNYNKKTKPKTQKPFYIV